MSAVQPLIVAFGDRQTTDPALVGAKGANPGLPTARGLSGSRVWRARRPARQGHGAHPLGTRRK